jgi:hypothetical protein
MAPDDCSLSSARRRLEHACTWTAPIATTAAANGRPIAASEQPTATTRKAITTNNHRDATTTKVTTISRHDGAHAGRSIPTAPTTI